MKTLFKVFLFIFFFAFLYSCEQPQPKKEGEKRLEQYAQYIRLKNDSRFNDLTWRFIGPELMSGRITDVAVHESDKDKIYVGSASGGAWVTPDQGKTWKPIFEDAPSTTIGDMAIAPSNPEIVWIGTGESNIFRSGNAGIGVYKSVDGGKSWEHKGLTETFTISRILVHPENPDIVYVAASGHEWTYNPERGVYKTLDGGENWEKVFFINDSVGAIDLVMDPENPEILYASMWNRIRKRWSDPVPSPGDGIFKTIDGGENWTLLTNGLPDYSKTGRIGIDVARSQPNTLYAFIDNHHPDTATEGNGQDAYGRRTDINILGPQVYRSDDKGETWRLVSEKSEKLQRFGGTYGWVFGQIRVDPNDPEKVFILGLTLAKSVDGGKTFDIRWYEGVHADHHALWIDPENSDYLVNGNDGGINISHDGGETWINIENLGVVQFYNVEYDFEDPFYIYGSIQDNGSWKGPVTHQPGVDSANQWVRVPGGEASYHEVDHEQPNILYSEGFYGRIQRTDFNIEDWREATKTILPEFEEDEEPLRGQWLAPFIISPHDHKTVYHGMQYVLKTTDQGESWEKISPDLTYNLEEKQGVPPYAISFQTISTLSESPIKQGLLYVGTDDGRIHVTKDDGLNWTEITGGLKKNTHISRVLASKYDESTVYVTLNDKRRDNFDAYIYKSEDYGATWKDISGNIPGGPVNVIIEDPEKEDVLFVGTDLAVYVSTNGGESWDVLANGMPTTYVHDLKIHPRDKVLIAATHGRGIYVMDLKPFYEMLN